jgi:capsular exopolysaccharide synthesis family protein
MNTYHNNLNIQEENELKKISDMFSRNYKLFIFCLIVVLGLAFLINKFSVQVFKISASILIKENSNTNNSASTGKDFMNSSLFTDNKNFQNELWVIKSTPVIERAIRNLDLFVTYYTKVGFRYIDSYKDTPFKVTYVPDHPQPLNVRFRITLINDNNFKIEAKGKNVLFYNFNTGEIANRRKDEWSFSREASFGEMIETNDMAFVITRGMDQDSSGIKQMPLAFDFRNIATLSNYYKKALEFKVVDRLSTVVELSMKTENVQKGVDLMNELMKVYSDQNLERKNHLASITIDYIEKQLNDISDSLSQTEDNLQRFRSSNQLLNITEQASGISVQYLNLENQLAELVTRKRYYDYVSEYLENNDNFSNMIVPASLGIQDPLLNNLMSELISAQAQLSNLVKNNQEKNPLVQKLNIQIDNVKKTIADNISAVSRTTSISIDEMNKRVSKIKGEISNIPVTQRKLGNIERKYRLDDAIYNYMLEKRAEAKITKASNLPDQIVIEPAKAGLYPVSPNKKLNYLIALFFGLVVPLGYLTLKDALNNKIQAQEDIESLTTVPVLGRILRNKSHLKHVVYKFPKSGIAESFRALRTNLDFYVRGGQNKIIMVTSGVENEGKTFIAQNLAVSYAQLGRKTILINFDLRKEESYFDKNHNTGLSSYLIDKANLSDIIFKSPQERLDYIPSGILPPNPVELIALVKTGDLLKELKSIYDIIILDTSPLAQVTDAYLLINHAELKLLVARQNFTIKKVFSLVVKDLKMKRIDNVCVVLNDNRDHYQRYGYGYGYNQNSNEKKEVS